MAKYILKRILLFIPIILGVTILVFSIMYFIPGDPTITILGADADPASLEALREKLGLNDPYLVRLGNYLYQVFIKGDLGTSYVTGLPVADELLSRLPHTLLLDVCSIVCSLVIGIPLGINAATHHNRPGDYGSMVLALIAVSIPGFWLALMLVLVFSTSLGWLPPYGLGGIEYWILPILSNSFFGVATQARQTRSAMLEVLGSDYIVMAKSKGMTQRDVIFKHALPNALIPIITVAGTGFAQMLGGGLLIETIFSIPGIGYYMVKAVSTRDYIVVQGGVLMLAIAFSVIILLTDIVMAFVDPRIKSQLAKR